MNEKLTPSQRARQALEKAEAEGLFNERGEWWGDDGVLIMIHPDFLAKVEDIPEGGWPDQHEWSTGRAARLI